MVKVSQSRIGTWKRCGYCHYLKYVLRIRKKGKVRPLYFGSDFHYLLEHYDHPKDLTNVKKAFSKIKKAYDKLSAKELTDIGGNYLNELQTIFKDYKYVYLPLETDTRELDFEIELRKDVLIRGKIDAIVETDNNIIIVEHKTFNKKPNSIVFDMNSQALIYAKVVRLLGYPSKPIKILWDYIHSKPAEEPPIVDGKLKLNKSSKIIPQSFRRAAMKVGWDKKEARNKSLEYLGNMENFFFRKEVMVFDSAIDSFWEDTMQDIKMIYKFGETCKSKNITRDCSWCDYQPICVLELNGGDVKGLIESQYEIKEEDNECSKTSKAD